MTIAYGGSSVQTSNQFIDIETLFADTTSCPNVKAVWSFVSSDIDLPSGLSITSPSKDTFKVELKAVTAFLNPGFWHQPITASVTMRVTLEGDLYEEGHSDLHVDKSFDLTI